MFHLFLKRRKMIKRSTYFIFVFVLCAGIMVTLASPIDIVPCCSDLNRQTRAQEQIYSGKIIDTHAHLDPGTDMKYIEEMTSLITQEVVSGIFLMPTPNHGLRSNSGKSSEHTAYLFERTNGAIKGLCGADYLNVWLGRSGEKVSEKELKQRLQRLTHQLNENWCFGVGEIAIRHFVKWNGQHKLIVPFESNGLQALLKLAESNFKPVDLHVEPMERNGKSSEREWFSEIDMLFSRYPDLNVIISHTAMTRAENVQKLIEKYPNVFFNIKIINRHENWNNLEPVNANKTRGREIYENWAQLFEKYPERFFVGTDFKFGRNTKKGGGKNDQVNKYVKTIRRYRKFLGSIDPEAAEMIAYKNVYKFFAF